jgi:pilus assembly protein CpaE
VTKPAFDDIPDGFETDDDFLNAPMKPWSEADKDEASAESAISPPVDDPALEAFADQESEGPDRQVIDEPDGELDDPRIADADIAEASEVEDLEFEDDTPKSGLDLAARLAEEIERELETRRAAEAVAASEPPAPKAFEPAPTEALDPAADSFTTAAKAFGARDGEADAMMAAEATEFPADDLGLAQEVDDAAIESVASAEIKTAAPMSSATSFGASDSDAGDASVPRIAIHIFTEKAETAAAAEQAFADRRMQKANTDIHTGGLSAAMEYYASQPTPTLVIVESQADPETLLQQLDRLAEVCDAGTKVIVIGKANDIALYRELIKRGVSEYLVPPIEPLPLIRAVTTLYSDPSAPFVGRSIAFVGAKGGVGASTLAHNFGYCLTETMQANGVIVDFDLPFGTAGLDFNQDPIQGVADALSQPDRLDPVLLDRMMVSCSDRLSLFAAPATLDDDYDISADAFEEVAAKIKATAPYVILDLPHVWSAWMRRVLLGADDVIIVATPDLASLRNAKNMIDLVQSQRPNDQAPRLILNQVGVPGRPEIPVKDFGEALGAPPALVLPFDPKLFGAAANNGQMIQEVQSRSKTVESLNHFVHLVCRREPPPPQKKSIFSGLLKRK